MKKILYYISMAACALLLAGEYVHAETPLYRKTLCLAYVSNDELTSEDQLVRYLQTRYDRAVSGEDYIFIVYLANEDSPIIVQVNTPDDNRNDFSALVSELKGQWHHDIDPKYDIRRIADILEKLEFVKPGTDELAYGALDMHFHVTSDFWKKGYNESLIASLCFVLGADHFTTDNFRLRCYFSRNDELTYDEEAPFGEKNFCNMEFMPYFY